jgi:general secretion pathway protein D
MKPPTTSLTDNNTVISNSSTTTEVKTVPVGLIMSVTPQISGNDVVTLNVRPTISRITRLVNDPNPEFARAGVESLVPEVQIREIESVLRINNGDIAIMGGLMQDTTSQQRTGVPVLSQLPLVGDLFSYRNDEYTKTELVIFLRPVVIKQASVDGDLSDYRTYLPSPAQPDVAPPTGLIRP